MIKIISVAFLFLCFTSIGQSQLKPMLHLRPFEELDNATVTALEEDELGQIWIGTQTGICFWDGLQMNKLKASPSTVIKMAVQDSFVYVVQLKEVLRINCKTLATKRYQFGYSNYRSCDFQDWGMVTISSDQKDTVLLNYHLQPVKRNTVHIAAETRYRLGAAEIVLQRNTNKTTILQEVETLLTEDYVSDVLSYDDNRLYIASHGGLIELESTSRGTITKTTHFENLRVEKLLKDRNENLWIATSSEGVYQIHRNLIVNHYYPQLNEDGSACPSWTFAAIEDALYVCTSNGMVRLFGESNGKTDLEEKTKGFFCFTAAATSNGIYIGTANDGLYRYSNGQMEHVLFDRENSLNNAISQIITEEQSILITTKSSIYRLGFDGQLTTLVSSEDNNAAYSMQLVPKVDGYFSANTDGLIQYTMQFEEDHRFNTSSSRIFSAVSSFKNHWWVGSLDGSIYQIQGKELVPQKSPDFQTLMIKASNNSLWFTGLSGAMQFVDNAFIRYGKENGFPLEEYNQGGLYVYKDSLILFSGVQGVFSYEQQHSKWKLKAPHWNIHCNGKYLPKSAAIELNYDQSVVNFTPKAIILSDRNRFVLDYYNGSAWKSFENGENLMIPVDYGSTQLKFRVRNVLTNEEVVYTYQIHRALPIWQRAWFIGLLVLISIMGIVGLYFLIKFFKTKRMLQKEAEEREISQERLRISRELHDNIGARLSHIVSSIDIQIFKNKEATELQSINTFAKETMSQLRETIWAVGDNTIFFSELKQRVENYIHQTKSTSNTQVSFQDHAPTDFELTATETINIFRIVQESLNNAMKYAEAQSLYVRFEMDEGQISVIIQDDGHGFDITQSKNLGSGLKGMENRAMEINAQFEMNSEEGKGTTITLKFSRK